MQKFFAPIIQRWDTVTAFAAEVGCPEKNAREWLRIDSIPASWFSPVNRAAVARGWTDITPVMLAELAENRRIIRSAKPRPIQEAAA
jgi:hypothetical protein